MDTLPMAISCRWTTFELAFVQGATRIYDCDLLDCLTHSSYSAYYGFINTFEWME